MKAMRAMKPMKAQKMAKAMVSARQRQPWSVARQRRLFRLPQEGVGEWVEIDGEMWWLKDRPSRSRIAKGKMAKVMVFRGRKEKTVGGLRKHDFKKNKDGKIVSKKASARATLAFKTSSFGKWIEAVKEARKMLKLTGFVAIKKGTPFYKAAKLYYDGRYYKAAPPGGPLENGYTLEGYDAFYPAASHPEDSTSSEQERAAERADEILGST